MRIVKVGLPTHRNSHHASRSKHLRMSSNLNSLLKERIRDAVAAIYDERGSSAENRYTTPEQVSKALLDVLFPDEHDHNTEITGVVRVPVASDSEGSTDSKKERANTMQVGDVIVIRGSFASGKMSSAAATEARRIFERIGIRTPRGFFSASAVAKEEEEDADCGFEFDRSEELAAETAASAGLRAQAARAAALRAGTKVAGGSDDSESEEIDFDDI